MLKDLNMEYVILGHSKRKQYFLETNEVINQKVQKVLSSKMTPILCVGETLEERESGKMNDVIATQIKEGLANLSFEQAKGVVVAYEPIWAIGTGKTATSDQANEMTMFIQKQLRDIPFYFFNYLFYALLRIPSFLRTVKSELFPVSLLKYHFL